MIDYRKCLYSPHNMTVQKTKVWFKKDCLYTSTFLVGFFLFLELAELESLEYDFDLDLDLPEPDFELELLDDLDLDTFFFSGDIFLSGTLRGLAFIGASVVAKSY